MPPTSSPQNYSAPPPPRPSAPLPFIAGLIAAFWPYNLSHPDHPNLILIGWLPLALLYLHRLFVAPNRRNALLAGLFIALLGITRWQLLLMAAPLISLFVLAQYLWHRSPSPQPSFLRERGADSLPLAGGGLGWGFLKYLLLTGFISIASHGPFPGPCRQLPIQAPRSH